MSSTKEAAVGVAGEYLCQITATEKARLITEVTSTAHGKDEMAICR
jgi:hypothetical protein